MYSWKILEAGSLKLRRCQNWLSLPTIPGEKAFFRSLPVSGWLTFMAASPCSLPLSAHDLSSLFSFYLSLSRVLGMERRPLHIPYKSYLPLCHILGLSLLKILYVGAGATTQSLEHSLILQLSRGYSPVTSALGDLASEDTVLRSTRAHTQSHMYTHT